MHVCMAFSGLRIAQDLISYNLQEIPIPSLGFEWLSVLVLQSAMHSLVIIIFLSVQLPVTV